MNAPEPIKLSDIDQYIEELIAIAETANTALSQCRRARMAVSAGAQKIAYSHLARVGTLLAEIYQAGNASEIELSFLPQRRAHRLSDPVREPSAQAGLGVQQPSAL